MARIADLREQMPRVPICSLCGREADAVWWGITTIAVCAECAMEALPALIADAADRRLGGGEGTLLRVVATFGRAAAINHLRDLRAAELPAPDIWEHFHAN